MSLRSALFIVAAVLLLSACSGTPSADEDSPPVLAEGDYLASSASTLEIVDGTVVRLGITEGRFTMSAGCNTLSFPFQRSGDQLVAGLGETTLMGCVTELADQDARLIGFIESGPVVSSSPDGFTLTGADGATLVFVSRAIADPDRAVEGTRWVLDAVVDGDAAVSAVGFDTVELVLNGGTASVTTGCSMGQASYALDGGNIVLGALELTPASAGDCAAGVAEAEAALVAVFGGTASATVQADTLELRRSGVGLNFREG